MSSYLANLLKQKLGDPSSLSPKQKVALIDEVMSAAEAKRQENADYSRQLSTRLAGNYAVKLNEHPDGFGFFYGSFWDEGTEHSHRVDVLPPRPLWSGDLRGDDADATHWIVYLNGEEVQRSETIEGLGVLQIVGGV